MKKVFDVNEVKGDILLVVVRKINNTNIIEIKFKKNKKSCTEILISLLQTIRKYLR